jgi:hypothetical protein
LGARLKEQGRVLTLLEKTAKEFPWILSEQIARFRDPTALAYYRRLKTGGYFPDLLVNVMPKHRLIYISIPKAASTRIRATLSAMTAQRMRSLKPHRRIKYRGPYGPRSMTVSSFFRLATAADTLRFSFVRNPYARAVSCWADKFYGKPLVAGDIFVNFYLASRSEVDRSLPAGADQTLPFRDFVLFASAMAKSRRDIHIQTQDDILSMPGIKLDLIGRVESFGDDFARVLDHIGAGEAVRRDAVIPVNESHIDDWSKYYTSDLADRIYRAYECDFDRFGYPRPIIPGKSQASPGERSCA